MPCWYWISYLIVLQSLESSNSLSMTKLKPGTWRPIVVKLEEEARLHFYNEFRYHPGCLWYRKVHGIINQRNLKRRNHKLYLHNLKTIHDRRYNKNIKHTYIRRWISYNGRREESFEESFKLEGLHDERERREKREMEWGMKSEVKLNVLTTGDRAFLNS